MGWYAVHFDLRVAGVASLRDVTNLVFRQSVEVRTEFRASQFRPVEPLGLNHDEPRYIHSYSVGDLFFDFFRDPSKYAITKLFGDF